MKTRQNFNDIKPGDVLIVKNDKDIYSYAIVKKINNVADQFKSMKDRNWLILTMKTKWGFVKPGKNKILTNGLNNKHKISKYTYYTNWKTALNDK